MVVPFLVMTVTITRSSASYIRKQQRVLLIFRNIADLRMAPPGPCIRTSIDHHESSKNRRLPVSTLQYRTPGLVDVHYGSLASTDDTNPVLHPPIVSRRGRHGHPPHIIHRTVVRTRSS
jgi:hypothetical protein